MRDDTVKRPLTRRSFLGGAAAGAAALLGLPGRSHAATTVRTATDPVTLGESGIVVSRLGLGTGSNGGSVQRALGQKDFTRLVHHAIDRGVTFFDTADNYGEMHERLAIALQGIDRERIQIQTKIPWGKFDRPLDQLDRYRRELNTDYFDSVLMHCTRTAEWPDEEKRLMDVLSEAKERQILRSHGVSMHGLLPLEATVLTDWPDVALVRVNHSGTHMDGPTGDWGEAGRRDEALPHIEKLHRNGKGIIGMKIIGNGDFTDPEVRRRSIHFVMQLDYVDAVVIGFKSPAEIDEAIASMNRSLGA